VKRTVVALAAAAVAATTVRALAAPAIIEGVPRIGWATGKYSYHIAALQAALSVMGRDVTYEELMLASGAGFRAAWRPGTYDYAVTCIHPENEDYVLNAARAVGVDARRLTFAQASDAQRAVTKSIDRGLPVIAWEDCGTQVICGYDLANAQMDVRSCNNAGAEYEVRPLKIPPSPPPLNAPNEIVLFTGPPTAEAPEKDWAAIVSRAIRFANHPPDDRLHGHYVFGLGAYDAWAQTLRGGTGDLSPAIGAAVTVSHANTLADARTAISTALAESAALHEAFAEAADCYLAEAAALKAIPGLLTPLRDDLGWEQRTELMGERLANRAVREEIVRMVEQAKEQEIAAVDALRRALADFAPIVETGEPAEQQASAAAREHYEEGLRLKQAGRHREAAAHLRAATDTDPHYVEAHWALAWALIELGDRAEAADEFRKVIELAPDSEKAHEAQKALQRLGP
jgi:TolA-binding protein